MKIQDDQTASGGLSINRYVGQRIYINDDMVIRVTRIQGSRVYLQFIGPKSVHIGRPSKDEDDRDRAFGRLERVQA